MIRKNFYTSGIRPNIALAESVPIPKPTKYVKTRSYTDGFKNGINKIPKAAEKLIIDTIKSPRVQTKNARKISITESSTGFIILSP